MCQNRQRPLFTEKHYYIFRIAFRHEHFLITSHFSRNIPQYYTEVFGLEMDAAAENVIVLLSKKWSLTVLAHLYEKKVLRFNELIRSIGNISPKSLSQRLKELISMGIVAKQQYNEIPPRVEYSLTESGKDLTTIFELLEAWGKKWGKKPPL